MKDFMKNFVKRYNGCLFPSSKPSSSENFGLLAIRFRYALQDVLPDFFVQDFIKGEHSLSGVLEKDGVLVGFSWNMQENELINTRDDSPERGVTLQTNNGYEVCCSVEGIAEAVRSLQKKETVLKEPNENNFAGMEER